MKHSERFENAVSKLYNAFHEGRLKGMDCEACAVGNICDNNGDWRYMPYYGMSNSWNREIYLETVKKTGYSDDELVNIERLFMYGVREGSFKHKWKNNETDETTETQFQGLCAVVEYLCELEGIENIMDYQSLFNPKRELELTQIF